EHFHPRRVEPRRLLLDVPLVPEREGEQPPQLTAPVPPTRDVLVDQPRDRLRLEEALAVQVLGRQRGARERLQLAAQPGGGRDREAALATVHDLRRQQRLHGLAQQHFLREAAHLEARRQ